MSLENNLIIKIKELYISEVLLISHMKYKCTPLLYLLPLLGGRHIPFHAVMINRQAQGESLYNKQQEEISFISKLNHSIT